MATNSTKNVRSGKKPDKDSSTQRYLPFSEIRDNMIIMKDGSSRMVLRVHALSFPIQIIARSLRVDIESYINRLKNLALKQNNPLLQEQTYKYIDFLMTLIDLAQIMKKEFYIVVPYDMENDESVRKNDFFGVFRSFWAGISQEDSVAEIRSKRVRAGRLKKGNAERIAMVKMSLEAVGLRAEELRKEELIKLVYNYYNPRVQSESLLKNDPDELDLQ